MSKFGYLKKLEIKDKTVRFELPFFAELGFENAYLKVKPADSTNKAYINAALRKSGNKNIQRMISSGVNSKMQEERRLIDKELFPLHVVVGWNDIPNSEGKPEPFSKEGIAEFIESMPDDMFDELRLFCMTPANFRETSDIDFEEKAKNLQAV